MTNAEIIYNEALLNNIFSEEEAVEYLKQTGELPLHTFATWKAKGYTVKKGEHAKITTRLWKFKKGKKKENEEEEDKYFLCKAFLFTIDQVEKIKVVA